MCLSHIAIDMARFTATLIQDDLIFPECLRWHENRLWFVDMYDGRLLSLRASGALSDDILVEHYKAKALLGGIILSHDEEALVIDKYARSLIRADGEVFADLKACGHSPLNDAIMLPNGQIIVGEYGFDMAAGEDFAKANLYAIDANRSVKIAATGLKFPNGMAVSPDGKMLYVAETMAGRISQFSIAQDGTLSHHDVLICFGQGHPDGMSIDSKGRIWVALLEQSSIICIDSNGAIVSELKLDAQPYDVAVADDATLYIGTSLAVAADLAKTERPRSGQIWEIKL